MLYCLFYFASYQQYCKDVSANAQSAGKMRALSPRPVTYMLCHLHSISDFKYDPRRSKAIIERDSFDRLKCSVESDSPLGL